jgi:hypothetical protein
VRVENNTKQVVLSCISALNEEDFEAAREYMNDDFFFESSFRPKAVALIESRWHINAAGIFCSYQHSPAIHHQALACPKCLFHEVAESAGYIFRFTDPFYQCAVADGSKQLLSVCRCHAVP